MKNVIESIVAKRNKLFTSFWTATQKNWAIINTMDVPAAQDMTDELLDGYLNVLEYTRSRNLIMPKRDQLIERLKEMETTDPEKFQLALSLLKEKRKKLGLSIHLGIYEPGVFTSMLREIDGNAVRIHLFQTHNILDIENKNVGVRLPDVFLESRKLSIRLIGEKPAFIPYEVKAEKTPNSIVAAEFLATEPGSFMIDVDWLDGAAQLREYRVSGNLHVSPV